jgi:hypothetical protein
MMQSVFMSVSRGPPQVADTYPGMQRKTLTLYASRLKKYANTKRLSAVPNMPLHVMMDIIHSYFDITEMM